MLIHELLGEQLHLLSEKAIYWPSEKTILIADSHLGKIQHFRKSGIAVPGRADLENILRLEALILKYKPEQVIFLGDLFHSDMNYEWLEFKSFVKKYREVRFVLIQGNHDILHLGSYKMFELHQEPLRYGPFILSHEPLDGSNLYNLCGHIHPGVRMTGLGRQSMRLPCYYFTKNQGVLPAFGVFTGLHMLKPSKQDSIFIIAGSEVISTS